MRKLDHMLRLIRAERLTSEQIEESVSIICDSDAGSSDLLLTFSEADLVWLCKMIHSDGLLKGYEESTDGLGT